MKTATMMLAGLLLSSGMIVAQEPPTAKTRVLCDFEEAQLAEVLASLGSQLGYKVMRSRAVPGDYAVTLTLGSGTPEVVCALLARQLDITIELHHDRKLIEVDESGGGYTFNKTCAFDVSAAIDADEAAQKILGPEPENAAIPAKDRVLGGMYDLRTAMLIAIGLEPNELAELDGLMISCSVNPRQKAEIEELFGLLVADGGGQSRWLAQQSKTWGKMNNGRVNLGDDDEEYSLTEVAERLATGLGAPVILGSDLRDGHGQDIESFGLGEMSLMDALSVVCRKFSLQSVLVGGVLMLLPEDESLSRYTETGYAVYDLGTLITDLTERSKRKPKPLGRDLAKDVLRVLHAAVGYNYKDCSPALIGTRIVVRGDMQVQEVVKEQLRAMGWKGK